MGIVIAIIDFFVSLAGGAESISNLYQKFDKRKKHYNASPFSQVSLKELYHSIPNPLRFIPAKLKRDGGVSSNTGLTIISGSSGVGKTREGLDLISGLSKIHGTENILLVKGYITKDVSLPANANIRKVLVLLDDYDYGIERTASESFIDRHNSQVSILENLKSLLKKLNSELELVSCVVTINIHRLPLKSEDINRIFPEAQFIILSPLSDNEFPQYVSTISEKLNLKFLDNSLPELLKLNDGRFDTVSTFLQSFKSGSKIDLNDIIEYKSNQAEIWKYYRSKLSNEQKQVYEIVNFLKTYDISLHTEYIKLIIEKKNEGFPVNRVEEIISSLWKTSESQILVYDTQFSAQAFDEKITKLYADVLIAVSRKFIRGNRYLYQQDMKCLILRLSHLQYHKTKFILLKVLRRRFPLDRFFTYYLALHYVENNKNITAMWYLYKVLRRPTPLAVYSGKWIEVRIHLLLARIYINTGSHQSGNLSLHNKLEHEFRVAAALADNETEDVDESGFELVYSNDNSGNEDRDLGNFLKELGYIAPPDIYYESKRLRALVHHEYSKYLIRETHRDYDVLKHEDIVIELAPDIEEAYLNCAIVCNRIGNNERALKYIYEAEKIIPAHISKLHYTYFIEREKALAYGSLGEIEKAKLYYDNCRKIINNLIDEGDKSLEEDLISPSEISNHWQQELFISQLRTKEFVTELIYKLNSLNISLILPSDWKIDREGIISDSHYSLFVASFSSQAIWNDRCEAPDNASITLEHV